MAAAEADALIVVDVQRAVMGGSGAIPNAANVLAAVERLVRKARDTGSLIVHVQNDGPAGAADEPGAPGWALAVLYREVGDRRVDLM